MSTTATHRDLPAASRRSQARAFRPSLLRNVHPDVHRLRGRRRHLLRGRLACSATSEPFAELPVLSLAVVTFNMTAPMAAWMRFRGMPRRAIAEMSAAMGVLAVGLLRLGWLGLVSMSTLPLLAHGPMMPAMLIPMLLRLDLYTGARLDAPTPARWLAPWFADVPSEVRLRRSTSPVRARNLREPAEPLGRYRGGFAISEECG